MANMLSEATNLTHIDFASMLFRGENPDIKFYNRGHLYGSIRLTYQSDSDDPDPYESGFAIAKSSGFMAGKNAVVMVRDPRDILISRYFYFGWHHPLSGHPEMRAVQKAQMRAIQNQTVDEYVLANAKSQAEAFQKAKEVMDDSSHSVLLNYEEMISDFDSFAKKLLSAIDFNQSTVDALHIQSRPRTNEDNSAHKRSGKAGGHKDHLKPETIVQLNALLEPELSEFGYSA